jgi:hypothetical protein
MRTAPFLSYVTSHGPFVNPTFPPFVVRGHAVSLMLGRSLKKPHSLAKFAEVGVIDAAADAVGVALQFAVTPELAALREPGSHRPRR